MRAVVLTLVFFFVVSSLPPVARGLASPSSPTTAGGRRRRRSPRLSPSSPLALLPVVVVRRRPSSFLLLRASRESAAPSSDGFSVRDEHDGSASASSVTVAEVDVRHGIRTPLTYDPTIGRYVPHASAAAASSSSGSEHDPTSSSDDGPRWKRRKRTVLRLRRFLRSSFLPESISPSYYPFMRWRILQRYVNANVHVFGTQSLLLSLGLNAERRSGTLGLGAALNWVSKDALGKIVRMIWASKMGRKFDPDAKRWRFRSSLIFALGNFLEVSTYVSPRWFLLWATLANCFKQTSMLTSSATRNAIYNSFRDDGGSRKGGRGGGRGGGGGGATENIGDITAKGEAQIAVVDLLGIASGICLSRAVGASVRSVLTVYLLLQSIEIYCMYHEIRSVVFRVLNFERLCRVVDGFLDAVHDERKNPKNDENDDDDGVPTPDEIATDERVFLPPRRLDRRAVAFGSVGRASLDPDELQRLTDVFRGEKFLLVVGENVKYGNGGGGRRRGWRRSGGRRRGEEEKRSEGTTEEEERKEEAMGNCHVILHADANNVDVVKSTLALAVLRRKLAVEASPPPTSMKGTFFDARETASRKGEPGASGGRRRRSRDCMDLVEASKRETDVLFPRFLNALSKKGWASPSRFMFGRTSMRAEWPIAPKRRVGGDGGAVSADRDDDDAKEEGEEGSHGAAVTSSGERDGGGGNVHAASSG